MKARIETVSQKPLQRKREKSQDQLQMENIAIRIKQNGPESAAAHDNTAEGGAESKIKYGKLEQKVVDEMWKDLDDFDNQIDELRDFTRKGLAK